MKNFWQNLDKPIYALAPMAGVADSAFRQICKEFGADVMYSEMASTTALVYAPEKTLELVRFNKTERPYVVQLFGNDPEHFKVATKIITEKIKPDGLDINFGCPVKKVQKQGAGAVLMKDLKLSYSIIESVIDNTDLPVSVKTRTKAGDVDVLKFLDYMKDLDIKTLMIHGRALNQGFSGEIDTEIIKKARNYFKGVILANGGINSKEDGLMILKETEADGLGIARGSMGKPWIFSKLKNLDVPDFKNKEEVFKIILKHAELVNKLKGEAGIIEMRKHLCWYVSGMEGAKRLREEFIKVNSLEDIKGVINKKYPL